MGKPKETKDVSQEIERLNGVFDKLGDMAQIARFSIDKLQKMLSAMKDTLDKKPKA